MTRLEDAPRPLEGRVRRGLELFLLGLTLLVGVVVVGGCGAMTIVASDSGWSDALGMFAGGVAVVGVVYLAISMSRDVRLLKTKLLEQEKGVRSRDES